MIDVEAWVERVQRAPRAVVGGADAPPPRAVATAAHVDRACREVGFFGVVGHGLDATHLDALDDASRRFFALPLADRAAISMLRAGRAWRGWFPLEGELTSGRPDRKEGLYFGPEHPADHPRVADGVPLHGANLWPDTVPELRSAVLGWMDALRPVADAVLRAIAVGLGLDECWFERHVTSDPTVLFRVFHYPPDDETDPDAERWGVGEHTDYGLVTLLAQDGTPGLQVRAPDGNWIDAPADREVLVVNLGDMLERATGGRYRSTPHRVRNRSGVDRLSFPYFYDPSWDATVPILPIDGAPTAGGLRWDGSDPTVFDGTYGEYLTAKVARVFPHLLTKI